MKRTKPYTDRGLSRVPCVRCGKPSEFNWFFCAEDQWRGMCRPCDEGLNELGLTYVFGKRKAAAKIKSYLSPKKPRARPKAAHLKYRSASP